MKTHVMLTFFLWFTATVMYSQVGMTTNSPNKDAVLDLNNADGTNTKGLLLPKVALTALNSPAPLSTHIKGMKVYNTTTTTVTGTSTNHVVPGVYYNDGTKWILEAQENTFWSATGNTGTVAGTNKIGTLSSYPFVTKTNNTEATRITTTDNYLIGTPATLTGGATATMAVKTDNPGSIQLIDGTQGAGKVLTSDANGLATWQEPLAEVIYPSFVPASGGADLDTFPSAGTGSFYTNCSLTLPPGKWMCTFNLIIKKVDGTYSASNSGAQFKTFFSTSSTADITPNKIFGYFYLMDNIYGYFPPNSLYGTIQGSTIIENNTSTNQTYYYWVERGFNSLVNMTVKLPAAGSENNVIAERIY
ncbi:hypothetical protein [Flavobacterium panacagri]|uniref:hypothetical protein n=1 Tax=Flavobacterium panacagri TaxID=3034146 RepID=UPI0025A5AB05|nr:hypothetical protein [Flavobacterium panacagri]